MHICPALLLLMLALHKVHCAGVCPHRCTCTQLRSRMLKVNCSCKSLDEFPSLPSETEELYLQHNKLTSVPTGTFDMLQALAKTNLSTNPWHCDCNILYLKLWLEDQAASMQEGVTCSTPTSLHRKPVVQLSETDVGSCSKHRTACSDFVYNDAFLFTLVVLLLCLLLVCISRTKTLHFKMEVNEDTMELEQTVRPTVSEARKRRTFTVGEPNKTASGKV